MRKSVINSSTRIQYTVYCLIELKVLLHGWEKCSECECECTCVCFCVCAWKKSVPNGTCVRVCVYVCVFLCVCMKEKCSEWYVCACLCVRVCVFVCVHVRKVFRMARVCVRTKKYGSLWTQQAVPPSWLEDMDDWCWSFSSANKNHMDFNRFTQYIVQNLGV